MSINAQIWIQAVTSYKLSQNKENHDATCQIFSEKKVFQFRCLILTLKYQVLVTAIAAAFHNTTALLCWVSK